MTDELVPQDAQELSLSEMQDKIVSLERQVQRLSLEISTLAERVPDSKIISPKFIERAFTVWGHYVVAGFIIAIPIMCFSVILAFIFGLFSQY
jgi:hypothetical protein